MNTNGKRTWNGYLRAILGIGMAAAITVGGVGCTVAAGTPAPASEGQAPEAVAEGFYDWYLGYAEQEGGNVMVDGAYRTRGELTEAFIAEVDAVLASPERRMGGGDPFLCAQDLPFRLTAGEVAVDGDAATVTMDALYTGNPMTSHFDVTLEREAGEWQIADVTCTMAHTPLTPAQTVESFYHLYLEASQMRNLLATGAYRDLPFLSGEFVGKVERILAGFDKGGYDPILCAQDLPSEVRAVEAVVEGREATVTAESSFEGHGFTVRLAEQDGQWLITDVACGR